MLKLLLSLSLQFSFLAITPAQAQIRADAPALTNFTEVSKGIYRGGRPDFAALPLLQNYHMKTVIDVQGGDASIPLMEDFEPGEKPEMIEQERILSLQLGFQFFNYPLSSIKNVNTAEGKAIHEILQIMSDPLNQPVFVHCEHGVDRTGLIIALYRVFHEGWTADDAHDEMMKMGHGHLGNQILTGAMDRYFRKVTKGH
jgi:protein tyrosine/serine phosphatase